MTEARAPQRPPRTQAAKPPVSPARAAAFAILERVATSQAHSDDLLHGPGMAPLSQPDRDLATALVLGTLRWQLALDARMRPFLSRPDLRLALPVELALRLGAFQLLHMDRIPPHAALNESVELVRVAGHAHAAGMVNAVLRRLTTAPPVRKPMVESAAALAERLGHPLWLVEGWIEQYGRAAAEAICAFDQREPGCGTIFADETETRPMPVMDAGSRLVAELTAAAQPTAEAVWDCCAAPGGKTIVLGRRLPRARLLATDTSPVRLKRLTDRLRRDLPEVAIELEQADASALPDVSRHFPLILCDVPCSGTGTLARNPEIRHRVQPEDLRRQAERQQRILRGALRHLAPGGRLVYSTCSLEAEECGAVVDAVLAEADPAIRQIAIEPLLTTLAGQGILLTPAAERGGWVRQDRLRTLPGAGFQGDGFFAAILERISL